MRELPALFSESVLGEAAEIVGGTGLRFAAVGFRSGPNRNHYCFRDQDLSEFCSSFVGVPFLVDHDTRHVGSRLGRVVASRLLGDEFVFDVEITADMGKSLWRQELIDRFSIGWNYRAITCSVCGQDWLDSECSHWPGRVYAVGEKGKSVVCELIFESPRGKELSAVNAPAVDGTRVLAALMELKEVGLMDKDMATAGDVALPAVAERGPEKIVMDLQRALLDARLAASGLAPAGQEAVRHHLLGLGRLDLVQIDAAIDVQRKAAAELRQVVVGHDPVDAGQMRSGREQFDLAFDALMSGRQPGAGVRPLSGIREAYILLSGDYEMTGRFRSDQVGLAAVDSTSMAGIVADALNKVVVNRFQEYPKWWAPIVTIEDFATLQTVRWMTLGGVGELPTVNEGQAYTELTWDDQTETSAWSKKAGYLGITLEAIDKDDTRRLQQAPRALAQAAWLSLSKAISTIFTTASGAGPTMSDSTVLFHSNHANVGSTALSTASWGATRAAMRKAAELNSSERLGALTAPRYLLVPPDLEATAIQVLASDADYTYALSNAPAAPMNPWAEGIDFQARLASAASRVIVVDLWTDANNWAAVADPNLYSSIGLGFRFGREPQIYSVADPNSGLMFSNDVMPIKARFFFATGPTDWRGLYKHNVA